MSDFIGANVPDTDFAEDDGTPNLAVRLALTSFAAEATDETAKALIGTLAAHRLLVPIVAQVDAMEHGVEKDSSMHAVTFVASDDRTAILAFSGIDALEAWNAEARPIPRASHVVAQSVLEQELDALIIDIAGPTPVTIESTMLVRLAMAKHQRQYLETALNSACDKLEELDGVEEALWEILEEEVEVELFVSHVSPDLAHHITEVLQDQTFTVVLDRPLSVQVTQTKPEN